MATNGPVSATDGVNVKLGADTGAATASVNDAASSIRAALGSISSALAGFSAKSAETSAAFVQHTAKINSSVKDLSESVRVRMGSVNSAFVQLRSGLLSVGAVLAGGTLFKEAVSSMLSMEDAVRTLQIAMGTTADQATKLAIALKLAGSDADTFAAMAFRVQMRLNTQGEEFDRLGVKVKDASGNFLPMEEILQNIYARMQDFKAGADQNGFALEMVGRQARDFANEMARLQAVQQRATELMQQFGIEMGPERQAQIEAYRIEVNAFKVGLEAIGDRIGEAVLPRLVSLAEYFNEVGPSAANVMVTAVKSLLTVFDYLITGAKEFWLSVKQTWDNVVEYTKALAKALPLILSGGWGAAYDVVAETNRNIVANTLKTNAEILGMEVDLQKRLANLWSDKPITPKTIVNLPRSGTERFTPKPQAGQDDSLIPGLENELKAEQDAYNKRMLMQGSFQTWSIEQTRDYWKNVLDQVDLSVKDRMAAENRYYDAERAVQIQAFQAYIANLDAQIAAQGKNINAKIALAQKEYDAEVQRYGAQSAQAAEAYKKIAQLRQQLADQVIKIAELQAAREESIAQHDYDMANLNLQQQVALRQISADQQYAIESQLEDKIYAVKKAALDKARAAADGDVVKQQEIDNQLLKLEQDYQTKKTQIANQAELERKQYALQAAQDVQDAFSTFLSDITTRTKSFSQAFKDMLNNINQQLVKLASQQIAKQLLGPGTEGGGFLNNLFGKIFGGGLFGGKSAGANSGATAADAAMTKLATDTTTASTTMSSQFQTALTTVSTTMSSALQEALDALTAAANSAAAALNSVGGGGLGGGGGLFGGAGGLFGQSDVGAFTDPFLSGFGIPSFAVGTNYVPKSGLAFIHQGEAIVPASVNKAARYAQPSSGMAVHNHFVVQGDVNQRSQGQIAAASAKGLAIARRRHL